MTEWQPMDTAPRDGTSVIAAVEAEATAEEASPEPVQKLHEFRSCDTCDHNDGFDCGPDEDDDGTGCDAWQPKTTEPVKTCETCALYERVHDHECAKDDSLRRPNNSCSDWQPDRDDDISRVYEEAKATMRAAAYDPEPLTKAKSCDTCNGDGIITVRVDGDVSCPDCCGTGKKEKK